MREPILKISDLKVNYGGIEAVKGISFDVPEGEIVTLIGSNGAGNDGEVRIGKVNEDKYYVYENGAWRASASEIENNLGACVSIRENEKHPLNSKYYICEIKAWKEITATEYGLGYCTTAKNGVVEKLNDVYYICKSEKWNVASVLEYDTYGKTCSTDGAIVGGRITPTNKYVCDAGAFRVANEQEITLNKGCVSYTENSEIRRQISETQDSVYTCKSGKWTGSVGIRYGTLKDERDNKTYKTVTIGTQTWMAENLNYSDSVSYPGMQKRNWCYKNSLDSCAKYGRLYTWAAAMDSAGTFSTNGNGCGDRKTCSPTYPVRGICPSGWHLPTKAEFEALFTNVGGESTAGKMLKSTSGWKSNANGTDVFGFSALPAGERDLNGTFTGVGGAAEFWSSTEYTSSYAYVMYLNCNGEYAHLNDHSTKYSGSSVRCVKD